MGKNEMNQEDEKMVKPQSVRDKYKKETVLLVIMAICCVIGNSGSGMVPDTFMIIALVLAVIIFVRIFKGRRKS